MAKDLKVSVLLDFYGEMLNEKPREIIEDYYNSDLSLAEIAEDKLISRQGVRDSIKRSEAMLFDMEERLGLYKRFNEYKIYLGEIIDCANKIQTLTQKEEIVSLADDIKKLANKLD